MVSTDKKLMHQKITTKQLPPLRWMNKKHGLPSVDLPRRNQRKSSTHGTKEKFNRIIKKNSLIYIKKTSKHRSYGIRDNLHQNLIFLKLKLD
jgi:hypothetical protein